MNLVIAGSSISELPPPLWGGVGDGVVGCGGGGDGDVGCGGAWATASSAAVEQKQESMLARRGAKALQPDAATFGMITSSLPRLMAMVADAI